MTQTTGGFTFRSVKIEYSLNGTAWTDMSGFANKIEVGGGEREIGEFFTADGDTPFLGAGKRGHIELGCMIAHTEGAGDPSEVIRAAQEAASQFWMRWSPKGGTSGQFMYTTGPGFIKEPIYPKGEVQSGDPIGIEFTLHAPSITKSVIA
jgi:hypothetical protein